MSAVIEGVAMQKLIDLLTQKVLDNIGKSKDVIPTFRIKSDSFSITELEKAKTTSQKFDLQNANLSFENELKRDTTLKQISLVPDFNFKTKGMVIVSIDDDSKPIFQSKSFDSFEDVTESIISANRKIKRNSIVKVFIKSSNGTEVGLTAQVTFGE